MKLLLMIISLVWLLFGVGLLALAIANPDLMPAVVPAAGTPEVADEGAPPAAAAEPQTAGVRAPPLWQQYADWLAWVAGIAWVFVFLLPALGLAALASILDALGRRGVPAATEPARRERAEAVKKRPVTEKVEPTIGKF